MKKILGEDNPLYDWELSSPVAVQTPEDYTNPIITVVLQTPLLSFVRF